MEKQDNVIQKSKETPLRDYQEEIMESRLDRVENKSIHRERCESQ